MKLCDEIIKNSAKNKMSAKSLAVVLAPAILSKKVNSPLIYKAPAGVMAAKEASLVLEVLIQNISTCFP